MKKIINTVLSLIKKTPKLFLVFLLCFMTLASCISNNENSSNPSYTVNSDGSISMSIDEFMSMYGSDSEDHHSHKEEESEDILSSEEKSSESKHEHVYKEEIVEPTCEEQGYTIYTCECSYSYKDNYVKELGHSYGDWYEVDAPSCEVDGLERRDCLNCDHFETEVISTPGHTHNGKYQYDEKSHWNIANCEHEGEFVNRSNHTYINGECSACGYIEVTNEYLTFKLSSDGTYYIASDCNEDATSITIPQYYNGLLVTSIGDYAFYNCSSLTSITIPNSVTSIGSYAFYNCSSLTTIEIPNSVTSIGDSAFYNCSSLTIVTFEEGSQLTSIGSSAFYNCSSLTNVYYSGTIEDWCNIVFSSFYSNPMYYASHFYMLDENNSWYEVTKIEIPSTITSIGKYQFYEFNNVTEIIIPNSVTSIGYYAFYGCSSLTSITIPNSVTSIGPSAFGGCSSLEIITLPFIGQNADGSGATHFGYIFGASYYSSNHSYVPNSLKEVVITGGTSIADYAFSSCSSLTSITIPNSVTSIGERAFYNCSSLTNVYCSGTIEDWCNITFSNEYSNPMSYASHFYMLDENNEWYEVTKIEIPNTVTSIGEYQFYGFDNVTEIIIPDSVTSIGYGAFSNCSSLISITIPNSVKSIGNSAFSKCSSLTSIVIPNSVTSIGSSAFYNCSSLTSITIPNSVISIGDSAFSRCSSLTSITIPNSVTSIGFSAFGGCSSLESITLPFVGNTATSTGSSALFVYIFGASSSSYNDYYVPSSLKEVIITGGTNIGNSAFSDCSSLTSITIPNSVTSIGSSAFYNCSSLTSITIPNSVTSIGKYAFYICSSLESITIPNSVISIGSSAFYNCSSLTTVTFEDGSQLTSISSYAFEDCSSLTLIVIPNSVTSIGEYAFEDCDSLIIYCEASSKPSGWDSDWISSSRPVYWGINENNFIEINGVQYVIVNGEAKVTDYVGNHSEVVIPSTIEINGTTYNVTSIGYKAFEDCRSLTSIVIPNSVKSIGSYAFYDCDSLTIYCEASSKPSGWNSDWDFSSGPVYWGINENNFIEINGVQYVIVNGEAVVTRYVGNDSEVVIPLSIEVNGTTYSVTSIGSSAFSRCSSLTSITIPNSVTSIGSYAFFSCSSLTSITIPNSVKSIGNYAFSYCSKITSITIPNSVTSIGYYAFSGCSSLTSITIPNSVTSIGDYAFRYCSSLTIYCEASSKPSGWSSAWNESGSLVLWGING